MGYARPNDTPPDVCRERDATDTFRGWSALWGGFGRLDRPPYEAVRVKEVLYR